MKKLINVSEPTYGVVEDFLIMDTEPVLGSWKIEVSTVDRNGTAHKVCGIQHKIIQY